MLYAADFAIIRAGATLLPIAFARRRQPATMLPGLLYAAFLRYHFDAASRRRCRRRHAYAVLLAPPLPSRLIASFSRLLPPSAYYAIAISPFSPLMPTFSGSPPPGGQQAELFSLSFTPRCHAAADLRAMPAAQKPRFAASPLCVDALPLQPAIFSMRAAAPARHTIFRRDDVARRQCQPLLIAAADAALSPNMMHAAPLSV